MDSRRASTSEILYAIHHVGGRIDHAPANTLVALVAEHHLYRPFSIDKIASTLEQYGIHGGDELVEPILDAIHHDVHYRELGRTITCVDRSAAQRALGAWLTLDVVWKQITATRAEIEADRARIAAAAEQRLAAKLAAKAAKQRALDEARATKKAAKSTAKTAPRASPPAAEPIPEPMASPSRAIEWSELDPSGLASLPARAPSVLAHGALVLDAHRFALAGQFEELLSPATLRAVDVHGYQHEAVLRVLRRMKGRAILADEVGLGKTIESIMVLREYQLRAMVRRAVVLVPPALVAQWTDELRARAGIEAHTVESMPDGDEARAQWMAQDGVFVLSTGWARTAKNAPLVRAPAWDLVMVDEAHHLKNRSTLAWQLVNTLRSRFLLLLTATPIESDLEELYNLVTLLRPGQFATPTAFRAQFVDSSNPTSPRNREQLKRSLADVMIRNTRAQSGLKLPPRLVTTQLVSISAPERELYDAIVAALRAYAEDASAKAITTTLLLEAGSSPHAIRATLEKMRSSAKQVSLLARLVRRSRQLPCSRTNCDLYAGRIDC